MYQLTLNAISQEYRSLVLEESCRWLYSASPISTSVHWENGLPRNIMLNNFYPAENVMTILFQTAGLVIKNAHISSINLNTWVAHSLSLVELFSFCVRIDYMSSCACLVGLPLKIPLKLYISCSLLSSRFMQTSKYSSSTDKSVPQSMFSPGMIIVF